MEKFKCPCCGSENSAEILYGLPAFSPELERDIEEGRICLGGCKIMDFPIGEDDYLELNPTRKCNKCGKEFGSPPYLISGDLELIEDYREIVKSIRFQVDESFDKAIRLTITKNKDGAFVNVTKIDNDNEVTEYKQISHEDWQKITDTLYSQMYLHEWKKHYINEAVLDGTSWELKVKLTGKRVRNNYGINAYPPYWQELKELMWKFV